MRQFHLTEDQGIRWIEAAPGEPGMTKSSAITGLIESCFSNRAQLALLQACHLTPNFFDLSSGEAGEILQKLRNYRIRLAVVCEPGAVRLSTRFAEMAEEEARKGHFRMFESETEAREWLSSSQPQ